MSCVVSVRTSIGTIGLGAVDVVVAVQAHVQLVAADLREVVALGVEEQRAQQGARVLERRRLARALLLEDLDQRLVLALGDVLLERERG